MGRLLAVFLSCLALTAPAEAAPSRTLFIAGQLDEGPAEDGPIEARVGQTVTLYAVVREGRGRRAIFYTDAGALKIGRRAVPQRRLRPLGDLGVRDPSWRQVEAQPKHSATPSPNEGDPTYSNTVLYGPDHGKWLGYDTLEYFETPLEGASSSRQLSGIQPSPPWRPRPEGVGTMRYAVSLTLPDGARLSSPGLEDQTSRGIAPSVYRVSFRRADDLVGWLESLHYVPYVFASAGHGDRHQADRHQGADCADVIIAAARKAGQRRPYTHVAGFYKVSRAVTPLLWLDETGVYGLTDKGERGAPVSIPFGEGGVQRGDLMVIDYVGFDGHSRTWDHVGVLARDEGQRGRLDPADPVLHMGRTDGLESEPASAQGPAVVHFLRLD